MIGIMEDSKIFEQLAYRVAREVAAERDRRHGVIMEDIQGKFKFLAEGQGVMQNRVDQFDTRFAGIEGKIDKVEIKIDVLTERVVILTERVDGLDAKFDALAEKMGEKVNKKDFAGLDRRVVKLEAQ
jgi:uncharacterized coiled-coil protein SlyX